MRFVRAFFRFVIASILLLIFLGFIVEELTLEEVDFIEIMIFSVFLGVFLAYVLYEYLMCVNDFLSKHKRNIWLWGFASVFPVILLIVLAFYTEDFESLFIDILFYGFSLGMITLHIFDFFYYRNQLPEKLSEMEGIIDF